MSECKHEQFRAECNTARLSHEEGGPVTGYSLSVRVECAQCGLHFRFIGLQAGNHFAEPRVSVDGKELRAPIEPATHEKFVARSASYSMPPKKGH